MIIDSNAASDAKATDTPPPAPPTSSPSPETTDVTFTTAVDGVVNAAGDATRSALHNELAYTLTVGQAIERFVAANRAPPSERSVQRWCADGKLAGQKIRTTYGMEYLINELSLDHIIAGEPVVASDAKSAETPPPASPTEPAVLASRADVAAPNDTTNANDAVPQMPKGETRTLVDVLIENATLLAKLDGKDELVSDLRNQRDFMREQVIAANQMSQRALSQGDSLLKTIQVMRIGPPQHSASLSSQDGDSNRAVQ